LTTGGGGFRPPVRPPEGADQPLPRLRSHSVSHFSHRRSAVLTWAGSPWP